jgi:hypothetical protein
VSQKERLAVFRPGFSEDLRYRVETDRKLALRAFSLIVSISYRPGIIINRTISSAEESSLVLLRQLDWASSVPCEIKGVKRLAEVSILRSSA